MRKLLTVIALTLILGSCTKKEAFEKVYLSHVINPGESFNEYPSEIDSAITFNVHQEKVGKTLGANPKVWYGVKFGDTVVRIQTNKADPNYSNEKFIRGKFMNTQKTSLLVQIADNFGYKAKFYLISLKNHQLSVTELRRPTAQEGDLNYIGLIHLGSEGYLLNNDFLINPVNSQVYFLKRENQDERIQGQYLLKSPDKGTLVFMKDSSLYQVNYENDESINVPLRIDPTKPGLYMYIQENYVWKSKRPRLSFLMEDKNPLVTN
ncbi:hypothetical protein [Pedobacter sp. JCM 36344]|uniref:hypothetical protein n=1 Tax=Pedobacter sp. JCM 36344 TaxID=3374280 RepID=UPI003977FF9C